MSAAFLLDALLSSALSSGVWSGTVISSGTVIVSVVRCMPASSGVMVTGAVTSAVIILTEPGGVYLGAVEEAAPEEFRLFVLFELYISAFSIKGCVSKSSKSSSVYAEDFRGTSSDGISDLLFSESEGFSSAPSVRSLFFLERLESTVIKTTKRATQAKAVTTVIIFRLLISFELSSFSAGRFISVNDTLFITASSIAV